MTIGIIGAGRMGRVLASAIMALGEPVLLVSGRELTPSPGGPARRRRQPVQLADVWQRAAMVILALPFPAALDLMAGTAARVGRHRSLVDVTNPGFTPEVQLPPGSSGGELIAQAARSWCVAKAFNTVPASVLRAHQLNGHPVSVPVAGDPAAKVEVFALARRLGFDPVDAGGITASRELESLAMLLFQVSAAHGLHGRVGIHIGQPVRTPRAELGLVRVS